MNFKKFISFCTFLVITSSIYAQSTKYHLLIGTYTSPGKSQGIYTYVFDTQSGEMTFKSVAATASPTYFAMSRDNKFIYAVGDDRANNTSNINSFAYDSKTGIVTPLNSQPSGGKGPTYISVDKKRKYVFAANYTGGSITAIPVEKDGTLGSDIQDIKHEGGSIARKAPNVHSAVVSPDNKYVLTADLGTDKINIYRFNAKNRPQPLSPAAQPFVILQPGAGPRHSTFHPNKKFYYVVTELNSTVNAFSYKKGSLSLLQSVSLVPEGYKGKGDGADVHVSADGKFLYANTRNAVNEMVIFSIDQKTGLLTMIGRQPTLGKSSRTFEIDPTGNWMLVTNQNSNDIIVFKRNKETGLLSPTGQKLAIDKPAMVKFVKID